MAARTATDVTTRGARVMTIIEKIGADPSAFGLVECGLHSGFPTCCIEFFVTVWHPWMLTNPRVLSPDARRVMKTYETTIRRDVAPGYVPCPSCLEARRFVTPRKCDWHLSARERRAAIERATKR